MNRAAAIRAVQIELEKIVRRHSAREVVLDETLGPEGHGLDSLSMVEFAVALEKAHGIEVPEEFWGDLGRRTPEEFVRLLTG